MKRDPNSHTEPEPREYGLPRSEILRGRRNFQRLFQRDVQVYRSRTVSLRFKVYPDPAEGCMMGFIVKTKLGKAAYRNRMKRIMREAYRLNKHLLTDLFANGTFGFHGVLMANTLEADFDSAREDVAYLLTQARNYLLSSQHQAS